MDFRQKTKNYNWDEIDCLGRGSYGKVFKGEDTYTGRPVAVKVIEKPNELVRQYALSVLDLCHINCEHVINYYAVEDVITQSGMRAIIMELADGSLLDELRKPENHYGLSKDLFLILMDHCAKALRSLDLYNIAHRDLKPENILICRNPEIIFKVTDFGCSRTFLSPDDPLSSIIGVGTLPYLPAAVVEENARNAKKGMYTKDEFDIWSAACTLFYASTGRLPFVPEEGRNCFEAMKELLDNRKPGTVCARFSRSRRTYVYDIDLPKQNDSYDGAFRNGLREFFQAMFKMDKEFLVLKKFVELCYRLIQLGSANTV